jgi:nitroreductase
MDKTAETDHPILDHIANRWSPYAYASSPVEPGKILTILEAARWAASSYNEQPWSFLVATQDKPEAFQRMLGCLVEANQNWAKRAPVLMISVASMTFDKNGKPNRCALHDVGLAMGNFCMQATALGLYVHQMAGIDQEKIREVYNIPDTHEPMAGIALGYLADPGDAPEELAKRDAGERSRKPLTDFVFGNRWGETDPLVLP